MAAKDQKAAKSTKRKLDSSNLKKSTDKRPKLLHSKPRDSNADKQPSKFNEQQRRVKFNSKKTEPPAKEKTVPRTKKESRIHSKEVTEERKKRRKPYYTLEQELASLWEKMRQRNIAKEDRSKLVTQALQKMKGKISEIASSHVSSRVLQTCVKHSSQAERDAVFEELRPHFLNLATNKYAVFLVKKLLDTASKNQLAGFISSFHGHVAQLLRHVVGSVVVEHAYQLGNASQKQQLLLELYSTELQLFKDLASTKETRLVDIISKLNLQKAAVLRFMAPIIQPILEKGIVDHSIIHKVIVEYLSIADKTSAADVIKELSSSLLVRMIHTRDGSKIGILCINHGSAKERKKIIKGMKGHVGKIAQDQCGSLVLCSILSTVDDTKLTTKIIIRELQTVLMELISDKNGRRVILQLLHPHCPRYFSPEDLALLNASVPSLCSKETEEKDSKNETQEDDDNKNEDSDVKAVSTEGGKKDPFLRRQELLVNSGLGESIINTCIECAGELLRSNFGKEVVYELATGGSDRILHPTLDDKLKTLHEAIASAAAEPRSEEAGEEHVLENFHSSRTIRKLIMDSPTFASTLWKGALQGKCKTWAKGHSAKVISAFLESSDPQLHELVKGELQPMVDDGTLKLSQPK
ncbi:hypothetical protein QQ045_021246 [Rhodiola kirilowii]